MSTQNKNHRHVDLKNKLGHQQDHEYWSRRGFLAALGISGIGSILPVKQTMNALKHSPLMRALYGAESDRVLIILRLKGGNDGLNTFVPMYDYDSYRNYRPTVGHKESDLINLTSDYAMPTYMDNFRNFWDDGKMKIVTGVGYEDQNLSHFTSSEIWASANEDLSSGSTGWMGRYFDTEFPDYLLSPPEYPPIIMVGNSGNLVMKGMDTAMGIAFSSPETLNQLVETGTIYNVENVPSCYYGEQLAITRNLVNSTFQYAKLIKESFDKSSTQADYESEVPEDFRQFAEQMSVIARLIKGGIQTKVFMIELDGFDTHEGQADWHPKLLKTIGFSLQAFYEDLKAQNLDSKVLTMTISEFGRRVYENGSAGTDHGAASPMILIGGELDAAGDTIIGDKSDLTSPDENGNLAYSTDFRTIYRSVLEGWLCVDSDLADELLGTTIGTLPELGLNCNQATAIQDVASNKKIISHRGFLRANQLVLEYDLPYNANIVTEVTNVSGQVIYRSKENQGKGHNLQSINLQSGSRGILFYTISVNGNRHSGKVAYL